MEVNSLSHKDDGWPKRLSNLHSPPSQLYIAGKIPDGPRVAIIGARRCTNYGRSVTELFAGGLARAGIVVVSGMAIGIDSIAHRAALEAGGKTIAVLPSSLDTIYPRRHTSLAKSIASCGAVITEYQQHHRPQAQDFIARNRIIAAMADVVLVTEATIKSGTSHTVRFALDLGTDVAATPGPITSRLSSGTHHMIKQGGYLVDSVADVLHLLGVPQHISRAVATVSPTQQRVINVLQQQPASISELLDQTSIPTDELTSTLTELESTKQVARSSDGVYALRSDHT